MPSLKQIYAEWDLVLDTYAETDLTPEQKLSFSAYMASLQAEEAEKIDASVSYINSLIGQIEFKKAEAKRLIDDAKHLESRVIHFKEYLKEQLLSRPEGDRKRNGKAYSIAIRMTPAVSIIDGATVPDEYMNIKIEKSPDKRLIKQAIEEGKEIDFARIVKNPSVILK